MTDAVAADFLPILAPAASRERSLIVSIHDVTPRTRQTADKVLQQLKPLGIPVSSLLVVPNYHHEGSAVDDQGFVSWLRQLETDDHEIVVHGYYHQRARANGETLSEKFMTRFYTDDEGEFYDISYDEALSRITRGRDELRAANLSPIGFIAPAWLLSAEAERAARDAQMQYTTRISGVLDLLTAQRQAAQALVYSTRSAWRRALSRAWNAALARSSELATLVRLSIHPRDIECPEVWAQIRRIAAHFARTRKVTTYRDWIAEKRATV